MERLVGATAAPYDAVGAPSTQMKPRAFFGAIGNAIYWTLAFVGMAVLGTIGAALGRELPLLGAGIGALVLVGLILMFWRPKSLRAEHYQEHCLKYSMEELGQRLEGKCATQDRKEWEISERERLDALHEAVACHIDPKRNRGW